MPKIEAAGVDGSLRPEQLDLAAFVRLADKLAEQVVESLPPPDSMNAIGRTHLWFTARYLPRLTPHQLRPAFRFRF
jgi:hypothetical protein